MNEEISKQKRQKLLRNDFERPCAIDATEDGTKCYENNFLAEKEDTAYIFAMQMVTLVSLTNEEFMKH
jgi:hypothetical protein